MGKLQLLLNATDVIPPSTHLLSNVHPVPSTTSTSLTTPGAPDSVMDHDGERR